jgi:hypothetical protein
MNLGDSFGFATLIWFLDQALEQLRDLLTDRDQLVGCLMGCLGCVIEVVMIVVVVGVFFGIVSVIGRLGGCG